jgi:hypothetical protein
MNAQTTINQFWSVAEAGKSCALDINSQTGELVFRATKSGSGEIGNGTPPIPMTDNWVRLMVCIKGVVSRG